MSVPAGTVGGVVGMNCTNWTEDTIPLCRYRHFSLFEGRCLGREELVIRGSCAQNEVCLQINAPYIVVFEIYNTTNGMTYVTIPLQNAL